MRKLAASAIMTSGGIGLIPLVPMMKGANKAIMTEAMRRVKEQAPIEQSEPLSLLLAGFISRSHSLELARTIYGRFFDMSNVDLLQEMPFFQELARRAAQPLVEEARVSTLREVALLSLQEHFGPVGDEVVQALNAADEATLKTIASRAGIDTLEQIRARLGLGVPQG